MVEIYSHHSRNHKSARKNYAEVDIAPALGELIIIIIDFIYRGLHI